MYLNKHIWLLFLVLFSSISLLYNSKLKAEGTKQLEPTATSFSKFQAGDDRVPNVATYNSPPDRRLYIHIEDPVVESIYYGFGKTFWDNDKKPFTGTFRIKDPNGNIVVPSTPIPSVGGGYINTRAEALIGPNVLTDGAGGYNPLFYKPALKGDYYIEFDFDKTVSPNLRFDFIDITVARNNEPLTGRLWSKVWSLVTLAQFNESHAKFFIYTEDSVVTSLDLNGMQPFGYGVMCNKLGTNVSANFLQSRKSINDPGGIYAYPEFKIFLNNPDEEVYPSYKISSKIKSVKINDCENNDPCKGISVDVDKDGLVEIYLDLDSNSKYTPNSPDVLINQNIQKGQNCIPWDGKDGLGKKVKPGTIIRVNATFLTGLTNFPITDPEYNTTGIKVELVRPSLNASPGPLPVSWDDSQVGGSAVSNCEGACHTWVKVIGDIRTINTWWHLFDIKAQKSIVYEPTPQASPSPTTDVICKKSETVKLGSPAEYPGFTFSWKEINGKAFTGDPTVAEPSFKIQSTVATTFNFELTISRGFCNYQAVSSVVMHPPLDRTLSGPQSICAGTNNLEYGLAEPSQGKIYSWEVKGGKIINNSQVNKINVDWDTSASTNASVSVKVIDYDDCPASDMVLPVQLKPSLRTPVPIGESYVCKTNIYTYEISNRANSTFTWTIDPVYGEIVGPSDQHRVSVKWYNDLLGNKETFIKVTEDFPTDPNTCVDKSAGVLAVSLRPLTTVNAGPDITICLGKSVNIGIENTDPDFDYRWNPVQHLTSASSPQTIFKGETDQAAPIKYFLYKTGKSSGCVAVDSILVNVNPLPNTPLSTHQVGFCPDETDPIEVKPLNVGNNIIRWLNVNTVGNSIFIDDIFLASLVKPVVYMQAESPEGCVYLDSVVIEDECPTKIFIPKAFSPNGDGSNDELKIFGINFTDFNMLIFNRWGEVVFQTNDRYLAWKGIYREDESPIETYPYIVTYRDYKKRKKQLKGTVTVIR